MDKKKTILISLVILIFGVGITVIIFSTEPTAEKAGARKETAMLVEIETVKQDTFQPVLQATGIVQAAEEIILSPRVSGEIIGRSENFVPGSTVDKGEVLLQIDPADYKNTLELRKSELMQAKADLDIEKGRQDVARQDYQLVNDSLSEMNRDLILRKPQLNAAQAAFQAAQTSVDQATLNLNRTTIRAPFDAQILFRNANIGSQVAPGDIMARLVGIDEYWIMVNLPAEKLNWLSFQNNQNQKGSEVTISDHKAWEKSSYRSGYLSKMIGALEDQTRLARIIVSIPDPLAQKKENTGLPSLIINSFVEVNIKGNKIPNVIRLNRDYIRKNATVWIFKNNRLRIQEVDILLQDAKYAYISGGISEKDSVVTSSLATVVDGARLQLKENNPASNNTQSQTENK